MIPLIVPMALGVALIGLFWPTEEKTDGKIRKNGSKRSGGDYAGKQVPGNTESHGRSRVVKPADSDKPKPKDNENEKVSADTNATGDVRGDKPGNDSGSQSDTVARDGEAEPVTEPVTEPEHATEGK